VEINRIHIFGASGSGVSTLGREIANELDFPCFESDDYFWKKTDPPFQEAYPLSEREDCLYKAVKELDSWILSGTLVSWGKSVEKLFDLAIYLYVPKEVRLTRIKSREKERFGTRIELGGDMYNGHLKFLEWACQYDEGELSGRSKLKHEEWMKTLDCPILKFEGDLDTKDVLREIKKEIFYLKLKKYIGQKVNVVIDRPMYSTHPRHPNIKYELNYGYISNTTSLDGHEIDAYILGVDKPIGRFEGNCIGFIQRDDDDDPKLLVAKEGLNFKVSIQRDS
jgi:adenylate kinase family enzyme